MLTVYMSWCIRYAKMSTEEKKEWKKKRKQLLPLFIAQIMVSQILIVIIFYGGYLYRDFIPLPWGYNFDGFLKYSMRWCAIPFVLILTYAAMSCVAKRVTTSAANPLAGNEHLLQLEKNILTNTLEQTVIALLVIFALTAYLDYYQIRVVPLYVVTFVLGRILFIVGYKINIKLRSSGAVMNFSSIFYMLLWIAYCNLSHYWRSIGQPREAL